MTFMPCRYRFTAGRIALGLLVLSSVGLAAPASAQLGAADLEPRKGEEDCPANLTISCGESVTAELRTEDCTDDQNRLLDVFRFTGTEGETITATLDPIDFQPHLELYDPAFEEVTEVEGQAGGETITLSHTLTSSSTSWRLVAKADDPGPAGLYTLSLQCSDSPVPPPPVPEGFFLDPSFPDFQFRVRIGPAGATIPGQRETICEPEAVCVSGAIPGRSEIFIRILGPRPNGFLWPTIVRFTPSRAVVDIRQVSSDTLQTYTLDAVPPSTDELCGLQDRTGFLP